MDLSAWREENLAKRQIENDKKWRFALTESYGERQGRKLFEKVYDPSEKIVFKKRPTQFSIDWNLRFDWSKQIEPYSKILN